MRNNGNDNNIKIVAKIFNIRGKEEEFEIILNKKERKENEIIEDLANQVNQHLNN